MAKPEPIPALRGKDAEELVERLKKPSIESPAKHLYLGALAEFRRAEDRARRKSKSGSGA